MGNLIINRITQNGVNPTFVPASVGGDTFVNDGKTFLHVKNGGAAAITVTMNSQKLCNYGFDHDHPISVPAGSELMIGPFDRLRFNNNTNSISITYSAVTTVTVAAIST